MLPVMFTVTVAFTFTSLSYSLDIFFRKGDFIRP